MVSVLKAPQVALVVKNRPANAQEFTITVPTKTKIEGKKRPEMVDVEHTFKYDEIKYTKNILQF